MRIVQDQPIHVDSCRFKTWSNQRLVQSPSGWEKRPWGWGNWSWPTTAPQSRSWAMAEVPGTSRRCDLVGYTTKVIRLIRLKSQFIGEFPMVIGLNSAGRCRYQVLSTITISHWDTMMLHGAGQQPWIDRNFGAPWKNDSIVPQDWKAAFAAQLPLRASPKAAGCQDTITEPKFHTSCHFPLPKFSNKSTCPSIRNSGEIPYWWIYHIFPSLCVVSW
jgi:hypothetical protein